jgi:ATP-binding cassette subfamily F protein uup
LAGLEKPDAGRITRRKQARIVFLPQEESFPDGTTVRGVLASSAAESSLEDHAQNAQISRLLRAFHFDDPEAIARNLSGGLKKRLAIAEAFAQSPDLLLLDEPTNHLDLEGINELGVLLSNADFAFVAVSHDRCFLEQVTNRVVELNPVYPDGFFSVSGSYSQFVQKRDEYHQSQTAHEESLSNIVRREEAFLRSNSKAQRTKSKDRIDEAYRLKDQLRDLRSRNATATPAGIDFEGTGRKTIKLLHANGVRKSLGGRLLFTDFSMLLSPGMRVGILGSNGSGKTTLIRVLTGAIPPDEGSVEFAEGLRIVVFDQQREQLPKHLTLREALAGAHDRVEFGGKTVHISAWAKRFLFSMDQLNMPVGTLSGGEQARILIARLMLRPADLLVLDEPTNDLDISSLEVLEQSLLEFAGAAILVSHDRFLMDRVCTEMVGLGPGGDVGRYGNATQWLSKRRQPSLTKRPAAPAKGPRSPAKPRLSASQRKELDEIEDRILDGEARVVELEQSLQDPSIGGDHVESQVRWQALLDARRDVERLFERWQELEALRQSTDPSGDA